MTEDFFTSRLKEQDIIERLDDICNENTQTTRCSTAVWDNHANQITKRHFCHKICKFYLFNNAEIRHQFCDKDDLKYAHMVIETATPHRYVCWTGFTCFMVPIIVYDQVVGLISIGEFLTQDNPKLSERFYRLVHDHNLPKNDIDRELERNVPIFSEENIQGLIKATEFLSKVIADILMGEISLNFDFDRLVKEFANIDEHYWLKFGKVELTSILVLKNIIKLQNLFLNYAFRKISEDKKVNLHKTLMPYQMILTAAENLRARRDVEKSYKQIVKSINQVEEYTLKSMRGFTLGDTQWLAIKEKKEIDLAVLIRAQLSLNGILIEHRHIRLDTEIPKGIRLWGRISDLEFLFATILENAIIAVDDKVGHISIHATIENSTVSIYFKDNGCGISEQDLSNVYNTGFRGGKFISKNPAGTGLGLALAQQIAHSHGGGLVIESLEDHGTTVRINLPVLTASSGRKSD